MSNEHTTEEAKNQPEEAGAIGERFLEERFLKDLVQTLRASNAEVVNNVCSVEPMRAFAGYPFRPPTTHMLVIIDKHGKMHSTVTTLVDAEQQASAEHEAEQSFNAYLAQIDQSREQAKAAQSEIDQLRTETRQLIAHLFAA